MNTGPAIGSKLPALAVVDQFGDKQQLSNIMGDQGAIIVLFRSADWCPFCKRHLLELNPVVKDFKKLGYGVIGISYDSPKTLKSFSQSKKLNFALLSDQNVATFSAFNVLNSAHQPGHKHYGIPYPGVIVVDANGIVKHTYFFEGYKKRVKFKKLLKQLEQG
ncbi:MAG: peroxiredoxin family protein [Enterobacterales bacterium]|nr:peroxiredoxin family protein [Enterobacterales bacterium]